MKLLPPLALLGAIASWVLLVMTFTNLLSGYMDERSCQTDCVKNYYFLAAGIGLVASLLALFAVVKKETRVFGSVALLAAAPPFAITAGIAVIGIFGSMLH